MNGIQEECCNIQHHIEETTECIRPKPGAYNMLIACKKWVTTTETDCTSQDAAVTSIVTMDDLGAIVPLFYRVSTSPKTLEYLFNYTYDPETRQITLDETINFQVDIKNRAFYCCIRDWIGTEVVVLFQEKGSDRWYVAGRDGDLTVNSISGGTGTTEFTPTSFVLGGTDLTSVFLEVFITDQATTDALIASVTAP